MGKNVLVVPGGKKWGNVWWFPGGKSGKCLIVFRGENWGKYFGGFQGEMGKCFGDFQEWGLGEKVFVVSGGKWENVRMLTWKVVPSTGCFIITFSLLSSTLSESVQSVPQLNSSFYYQPAAFLKNELRSVIILRRGIKTIFPLKSLLKSNFLRSVVLNISSS